MRFLVVTGLSGAGKTSVNRYLEDMGAFCVDNLPPNMMFRMMEAIEKSALHRPLVAMAGGARPPPSLRGGGGAPISRWPPSCGTSYSTAEYPRRLRPYLPNSR